MPKRSEPFFDCYNEDEFGNRSSMSLLEMAVLWPAAFLVMLFILPYVCVRRVFTGSWNA